MYAATIAGSVRGLGVPAGYGIALLLDIPDRHSGDGRPQRVAQQEHGSVLDTGRGGA
jgi:hypothetical protein